MSERLPYSQQQTTWNNSSATLVPGRVHTQATEKSNSSRGHYPKSERRYPPSGPGRPAEQLISRLKKDASKADRPGYLKLDYFSNTDDGTKFAKLGIGQLLLEGKINHNQIFNFVNENGGHRCLVCNRLLNDNVLSITQIQMSGEKAKIRANFHNIICSGDCYVSYGNSHIILRLFRNITRITNTLDTHFLGCSSGLPLF